MVGFQIVNKIVGKDVFVFIIVEVGINYDGKFDQVFVLIDVVVEVGVDVVKF